MWRRLEMRWRKRLYHAKEMRANLTACGEGM